MASRPKHAVRVVVYYTEAQYIDVLKSAAKFDKVPSEWIRFTTLLSMHGSMGMSEAAIKSNRRAFEALGQEGQEE